jgi:hypothetical protein
MKPIKQILSEMDYLKIYSREETYSSNKHFGSFVFWELVDLVSNMILFAVFVVIWEFLLRDLVIAFL